MELATPFVQQTNGSAEITSHVSYKDLKETPLNKYFTDA